MNNLITKYCDFILESRIPIAWAKPSKLTLNVLSFINEKERVSKKELCDFLDGIEEDNFGKKPKLSWIRNNKQYIGYKIEEYESNFYFLTPLGKRVLKSGIMNETI